jgi:hypothetical protein
MAKIDKWVHWACEERDWYRKQLANAKARKFRTSEDDGLGNWKDTTAEHIARLESVIASLDEMIGEDAASPER